MHTIFHITGGLGKHVLSSSIINSYKDQNPDRDIIVSSAYPTIFARNPNIEESLNLNSNQYFYKNYIYGKDVIIHAQEPYKQTSHILHKSHLIDTWCDMIGITHTKPPSLHPNFRELEITKQKCISLTDKPIMIFQPFGGPPTQNMPYCWARDIHPSLAQNIIDHFKNSYNILHICNDNHPILNNCVRIEERLNPMILFSLLLFSSKRILIDSCLQHACNALGLTADVLWVSTPPSVFGYPIHNNITPNSTYPNGHTGSYFFDYEISGIIPECPYTSPDEIYKFEDIVNKL
jgi:hypothetical protein